ncbi:endogenous retrovirus group K member 113 Pol protein-like [Elysia marginata]|uniref:Endogenous retrovirus group K member 113 Pol protein-like n=1 Tax=Elysia marginata TaxID=1093978 RepID=A0AAV4HIM9_9GAST|nr:endogenous retrovirus group K member 113 Pol protein-like [Elysia marginata]
MADRCESCQNLKPANHKETIQQHEMPESPWKKIAYDLMELQGRHYLITVDYYSNFIEADFLTMTSAEMVTNKLKGHFARVGVPKVVISDCGHQFTSRKSSVIRIDDAPLRAKTVAIIM